MSAGETAAGRDGLVVGLAAGAGAAVLIVWLWGGLGGLLASGRWPALGLWRLLGVLVRLPGHAGDPRAAWPAPVSRMLPGPPLLYGCLVLLIGGAGLTLALVARLVPGAAGRVRPLRPGARWASAFELRALRAGPRSVSFHRWRSASSEPTAASGRLTLGRHRGRTLYAERRHALVVFGPPQSGKSAGLAIPALLEWTGPAIASSIKTDLLSATLARRRRLGRAFVFDPFELSGARGDTWSPLRSAGTWDGALEVAWRLTAAAEIDSRGVEGGDFWRTAAEQRLAPLLFAAARSEAGMDQVVAWGYGQARRDLERALDGASRSAASPQAEADARAAYEAAQAFEAQADRTRSSIEATVQTLLRAYRFARVARSAAGCAITADALLGSDATLYLVGDAKASKLLRPLFLALVAEVVDRAYELAGEQGGALVRPLLVCLDEAGNVAPLPNLGEIASTAPSHNIQLVSIFHDLAQTRSRYGQQAETVVNSHRARMLLPGVADLETLRYFSGLVGEEEARELTRTSGAGGSSRSLSPRRRPLAAADALRQLPDGRALLLYGRLPPAQIRLRRWFEDRRLRRLAGSDGAA